MKIRALSPALGLLSIASAVTGQAAEIIISVPGIAGPYCAYGVEKRPLEIDGIKNVSVRWQTEKISAELEPEPDFEAYMQGGVREPIYRAELRRRELFRLSHFLY